MSGRLVRGASALTAAFRVASVGVLWALLILAVVHVAARYVFRAPLFWSEEVLRYLVVWLCFMGTAAAMGERSHLNVDALDQLLPPAAKRWTDAFAYTIVFVALVVLVVLSWENVQRFAAIRTPSSNLPRGLVDGTVLLALAASALLALTNAIENVLGIGGGAVRDAGRPGPDAGSDDR